MKYLTIRDENFLPFLFGAILLTYLVLRVWIMPISDDEYTTINVHATMSWWNILVTGQPNIVWAPNNHVLNTLFVKLEMGCFGKKDWAVRLHILAAFVFCYYYGTKIIQRITSSHWRQWFYILILFFNPYLLDFFGIARGYALSIAAFTASFYYFLLYIESFSLKHLRYIFLGLLVALWSNFSAAYLMLLMVMLICLEVYGHRKEIPMRKHLITIFISCSVITIIIVPPLLKTILSGEAFGGKTGLFRDSVVNYINQYIHHNPFINRHADFSPGWKYIEVAGIVFLLSWLILHMISFFCTSNSRLVKMQLYTLFLVIGVGIIAKILFVFFEVPYPTARTELLFSIPFYLGICIAFERIITFHPKALIFLWVITVILCWHFLFSVRFDNTIEWWQTGDAKRVVKYLDNKLADYKSEKLPTIGIESWQYPSLAFYTETQLKERITTKWTDLSLNDHYDYLFVSTHMAEKVSDAYEVVQKFKHGILYKLKSES